MALITKMHRCAFCGSSEVTVSENGTYTCRDCGKTADHGMPAADVEAVNRILMTGLALTTFGMGVANFFGVYILNGRHLVQGEPSPVLNLQPRAAMVYLLRR